MKSEFFDVETMIGTERDPDPDHAQELANTQGENQDDDPETSPEEKARNWRLSGLTPEDFRNYDNQGE
jgi:hypothetical protein